MRWNQKKICKIKEIKPYDITTLAKQISRRKNIKISSVLPQVYFCFNLFSRNDTYDKYYVNINLFDTYLMCFAKFNNLSTIRLLTK